ncbi:hypothetical protein Cni_G23802 [Canna indica]|uniref:C2H2-type domain-containing protein n=1 Tax=Canna indica TaxID=4628 RepID=A0AAQ3QJI3_9LILI|nr:hypothetical protein Cni_G23802 [Canna indica]
MQELKTQLSTATADICIYVSTSLVELLDQHRHLQAINDLLVASNAAQLRFGRIREINMKRSTYRFVSGEGRKMEGVNMANILMLLSRGVDRESTRDVVGDDLGERVFECKTCNRRFPSFQALGGHRASHKKPRLGHEQLVAGGEAAKPKVHECSICGVEFAIGQALGGHMRRHRAAAPAPQASTLVLAEKKKRNQGGLMLLDLNLPPLENDLKLGLGLETAVDTKMNPVLDCCLY